VPSQTISIGHAAFGGIARANAMLFGVLARSPRDAVGLFVALLAAGVILVNALYMQPGPHPAPIFSVKPRPVAEPVAVMPRARPDTAPKVEPLPRIAPKAEPVPMPTPRVAAPKDPIAELIAPAPRVIAVQRALNDYGYGPVKATGVYGPETVAAIEKFERDRKLPVTGQISPRLMRELAALTGKPLE
jgi:hypothetical protein